MGAAFLIWTAVSSSTSMLQVPGQVAQPTGSSRDWRATWRIRSSHRHGSEYYDAVAVGDMARADIIARALGGLCPMPPPLPSREGIPRIFALPDRA